MFRQRILIFYILWIYVGLGLSHAQTRIPFIDLLHAYEEELDIKFSYDPALIEIISKGFEPSIDFESFLAEAKVSLPIDIQKISEDYYTIAVIESEFTLSLTDSLESETLAPPFFFLVNSNPIKLESRNNETLFNYKPTLGDTLIIYAPGFEKRLVPLEYMLNQKSISFSLLTQTFLLNDLLIEDYITRGINLDPSNQKVSIDIKNLPLLPGETDGDIFASLAALPGITTPDGRPGNLFIRGNSIDQSLILFDNIPIYHRGHYFGTISPYNPKVVDNVEVFKSGFHPRLGGRVGGAININSEKEVSNEPQYGIGMNTLFAMAYGKTPLSNNKVGISIGIRHSYPSSFQSPKLKAISKSVFSGTGLQDEDGEMTTDVAVTFQDYNAKLIYIPNAKNKFSLTGIYSYSDLGYEMINGAQAGSAEHLEFENYGINTEWKYQFNQQWASRFTSTYSDYTFSDISTNPNQSQQQLFAINNLKDFNSRLEFSNNPKTNYQWQFGLDYKWQSTLLNFSGIEAISQNPIRINNTLIAHTYSPFTNFEWNGFDRWYIQVGMRGSYYSLNKSFQLSPRIFANFDVTSWLSLKASTGIYHQHLSQVKNLEFGGGGFDNELWQLADDKNSHVISGTQHMIGGLVHNKEWVFDIEAYSKKAENITFYEARNFNQISTFFTASQHLFGIDTYLKKALSKEVSVWAGYSFNGSKVELDTTDQTSYKSKYVQPHVFYLGTALEKNRWKFSAVWKYGSGLNAQSLEIAHAEVVYERAQENRPPGAPVPPNPFSDVPERYPSIHSMDISASYKLPRTDERKWSASFGLSVINLFNTENLTDRVYRGNPPPGQFRDRYALGFAPNLMIMIEW